MKPYVAVVGAGALKPAVRMDGNAARLSAGLPSVLLQVAGSRKGAAAATRVCVAPRLQAPSPAARVRLRPLPVGGGAARKAPLSVSSAARRAPRASGGTSQYGNAYHGLPPWLPSVEELDEFDATDFSVAAKRERFVLESKEAAAAVKGAAAGVFRPLLDNFNDLRNLDSAYDTEEFHIGMLFGAVMACIGMYQLWKMNASTCLDVALACLFYKLSILAADVRRRGFSPDWIIRFKLVVVTIMTFKDFTRMMAPLDYIRLPVFFMYVLSFMWDSYGMKKYAKYAIPIIINTSFGDWERKWRPMDIKD